MQRTAISLLSILTLLGACGGREHRHGASSSESAVMTGALRQPVAAQGGDVAMALVGKEWHELDEPLRGVTELKASGRGSVVAIGGATIWLRTESHVRVGSDAKGQLVVDLLAGEARVKHSEGGLLVMGQDEALVQGRDLLLSHRGVSTKVALTEQQPQHVHWSMELDRAPEPRGVGSLENTSGKSPLPLELRKLLVSVHLDGGVAMTEVEHVFYNDSDQVVEGSFRFPAPDDVMVTGLAMEIGGRLLEGEFVERSKAREVYEEIVDQMQDPALLEWQQGGWFKLRVFPIEAHSEKRVVLRYQAPLAASLEGYEYRYLATPPARSLVRHFEVRLNGALVTRASDLTSARDVVLAFPPEVVPRIAAEERGAYSYRALSIDPSWWQQEQAPESGPRGNKRLVLALDSSRSAIENRELSLELMAMLLAELGPDDEFAFFAHDIAAREEFMGFLPATKQNIEGAIAFYRALELDGASDLAATMSYAAKLSKGMDDVQVIYIGDGTPSWGATQPESLRAAVSRLGSTPLFAAILGRGASTSLWRDLTGLQGGTLVRPQTPLEARQVAFFLARAGRLKRLQSASIVPMPGVEIFPDTPRTLFEGESLNVVLRAPIGEMPSSLTMEGYLGSDRMRQSIALGPQTQLAHTVAQRWASQKIARMERDQAEVETIVEMSREFGVQSKHTSLLVLESEEAYRQHQIERKQAQERLLAANTPQVSGGDLDNLGGRQASLSPDHIQPGDPEVRIPAPADARSVVLIFPFGDTKIAHYDAENQTWIARFLIAPDTADGQYWVRVHIEHRDGRLEELRLPYTVDTRAPRVSVKIVKKSGKRYQVLVQELHAEGEPAMDATRVEVRLPGGRSEPLYRKSEGLFRRVFRAQTALGETVHLRVVVTDAALNQRVVELELPVEAD